MTTRAGTLLAGLLLCVAPARGAPEKPIPPEEQLRQVEKAARDYFRAGEEERGRFRFEPTLDQHLAEHEEAVRQTVWKAYRDAPIHDAVTKDFENKQVRYERHLSPYTVKKVGKRPEKGWPLFIALHGGGGAPKTLNDDQWKIMQVYYRDQAAVPGYQYVALRAPNDAWNGFYDDYVPPLVVNLIRQFLLLGDVDPDKVFLMGYSHGGYGAFFIGPKVPDRFAAVHASAAAPTDGSISPRTLRNTRFTFMIGDRDTAYGRFDRCRAFDQVVRKLKEQDGDAYPVEMELKKGLGHGGLPDRDKIKDMYPFTRNPTPRRLTWELTDSVVGHHFWLSVPRPRRGQALDVTLSADTLTISTRDVEEFDLHLDGRLVKFDRTLRVSVDGKVQELKVVPRMQSLCQSLLERGDPRLSFTCRIRLRPEKK